MENISEIKQKTGNPPIEEIVKDTTGRLFKKYIYIPYKDKIHTTCFNYLGDKEANDATSEILLKIFEKLSSFNGKSKLSTWIFSITKNYCFDRLRRSKSGTSIKLISDGEDFLRILSLEKGFDEYDGEDFEVKEKLFSFLKEKFKKYGIDLDKIKKLEDIQSLHEEMLYESKQKSNIKNIEKYICYLFLRSFFLGEENKAIASDLDTTESAIKMAIKRGKERWKREYENYLTQKNS